VIRRLRHGWDRFWFAPLEARAAAVFRIALGLLLVLWYLAASAHWARWFGAGGVLSLGDPAVTTRPMDWWSPITWLDGVVPIDAWWWLGILAAAGLAAGACSRACAAFLFVLHTAIVHRNWAVANGEDLILRLLCFYAMFARLGTVWSLDRWRTGTAPPAERWPIRLAQLTIALVYVFTQINKLVWEPLWPAGNALYHVMALTPWGRWPGPEPFLDPILAAAATWGSLALELAFPFAVWVPRLRRFAVVAIVGLHAAIGAMVAGVGFFNLSMMVAALVFLTDRDLERLAAACRRWWTRPDAVPPPRLVRWAVLAAAVYGVATVVLVNVPTLLATGDGPAAAGARWLRRHAHYLALDGHWMMFGQLPREDWWLTVTAQRLDGRRIRLPHPLRLREPAVPLWLADALEPKLDLNLIASQPHREAYARHVCRMLAARGTPARAVTLARQHRAILEPAVARRRADHHAAGVETQLLETVPCPVS
jgi:hypothetical protein